MGEIRTFESGATRDTDQGKLDFEGFLHPLCIEAFAEYMNKHRIQSDGSLRDSDNWQKGIPKSALMKSAWRHFLDWWKQHRGYRGKEALKDSLCALIFNTQGYLLAIVQEERDADSDSAARQMAQMSAAGSGLGQGILGHIGSDGSFATQPEALAKQQAPEKPLTAWERLTQAMGAR